MDNLDRNLDDAIQQMLRKLHKAAEKIAALLETYAKGHHGKTARPAGWVYLGYKTPKTFTGVNAAGKKRRFRILTAARRWRRAGSGWGDVSGSTTTGIVGTSELTDHFIRIILAAQMDYNVFLELAHDGKWAWLWPAIEDNLPKIKRILSEAQL